MGGRSSKPIQLEPAPGFQKRKANTFPGYESYDFGGYEIWGPYKKPQIEGPFGSSDWHPRNKTVDEADLLEVCTLAEGQLKIPEPNSSAPTLLRSWSSFSTTPNVGTDRPACYQDNMGFSAKDDGLFYIHYKHPMFARIMPKEPIPRAGWTGLLPTMYQAQKINEAKTEKNLRNVFMQRPSEPSIWKMSFQNIAETGYLLYKGKKVMNRIDKIELPRGIQIPLDQAVRIISQKSAIFNFGQKRTLNGGKRRYLKRRATRKIYRDG